jgi:hypothetical protein
MKTYRCYFLDENSRVRALRSIACADDDAAMTRAANLLKQNPYSSVELWHRDRWVAQWQNRSKPKGANEGQVTPFKGSRAVRIEAPVSS